MTASIENPIIKARQQFADANGWQVGEEFAFNDLVAPFTGFRLSHIIDEAEYGCLVDHAECFRKDGEPVAIVGHNYDGDGYQYGWQCITEFCAPLGLMVRVAPAGKAASWYCPNRATLLVITQPEIQVVWPTLEQMIENAERRAIYLEHVRQADRELEERVRLHRLLMPAA